MIYGIVGTNSQVVDNESLAPPWIVMSTVRPTMLHIARVDGSWELSPADQLASIASWRTRQENTEVTFELNGRTWDAGLRSRTRIEPLLKLKQLPVGFFWTDHDNNDVPVTMEELRAIGDAMNDTIVARGFAIHARQRQMKAELEDMTAEELMAFVPGWPDEQA